MSGVKRPRDEEDHPAAPHLAQYPPQPQFASTFAPLAVNAPLRIQPHPRVEEPGLVNAPQMAIPAVTAGAMHPQIAPQGLPPQVPVHYPPPVAPQVPHVAAQPMVPPPMAPPALAPQADDNSSARLKVEDALSYLDEVKRQFGHQPHVYNKFLDIMKEFKSQNINTPGVIAAVSDLFKGHPALINGFNTFLPAGYKIEVHENGMDIMVSQPGQPPRQTSMAMYAMENRHPPGQVDTAAQDAKKTPVEFNHAINYVNKIKSRFADAPDTYKLFLEILHTYQKEQRGIKEVYAHVAKLFHAHPDLLEEFSQFLPDTESEDAAAAQQAAAVHAPAQAKRKIVTPAAPTSQPAVNRTAKRAPQKEPVPPTYVSYNERTFFEKVKRALNNRTTFEDFLRCLQLYNLDIINVGELVQLVSMFLAKFPDLMRRFKEFVGYQDVYVSVDRPEQEQPVTKKVSASYHTAPPDYPKQRCSGRTPLCSSVLNDEYVSIPNYAEEPQFVAVKKNQYEENLFRIEDERFELDSLIESNLTTIRALECVVRELSSKSADEQARYKFNPRALNGTSETIYRVCVRRIYGERGDDVLNAVARDPVNNISIVLKRLKQKHNEWRRAQKQWNVLWREGFEKNYLKSLDVKGPTFKKTDVNQYRPKSLKERFEQVADELKAYREKAKNAGTATATEAEAKVPSPVLQETNYSDDSVLADIAGLIMYQFKRIAAGSEERDRIENILLNFIPSLLFYKSDVAPSTEAAAEEKPDTAAASTTESAENTQNGEVKSNEAETAESSTEPTTATTAEPAQGDKMDETVDTTKEEATEADGQQSSSTFQQQIMTQVKSEASNTTHDSHLFYANDQWAILMALHGTLYERVLEAKQMSRAIAQEALQAKDKPAEIPCALGLSLIVPLDIPKEKYFEALIDLCEKLLDNQIEIAAFEDTMREMFNNKAYKLYTIDKLISHTARQLMTVAADVTSNGLMGLYLDAVSKKMPYAEYEDKARRQNEGLLYVLNQKTQHQLSLEIAESNGSATAQPQFSSEYAEYVRRYGMMEATYPELEAKTSRVYLKRNVRQSGFQNNPSPAGHNLFIDNWLACNIDHNDYKMTFVTNSRDFMYRFHQHAKPDAEADRQRRHDKYENVVNKWKAANVPADNEQEISTWLSAGTEDKLTQPGQASA